MMTDESIALVRLPLLYVLLSSLFLWDMLFYLYGRQGYHRQQRKEVDFSYLMKRDRSIDRDVSSPDFTSLKRRERKNEICLWCISSLRSSLILFFYLSLFE